MKNLLMVAALGFCAMTARAGQYYQLDQTASSATMKLVGQLNLTGTEAVTTVSANLVSASAMTAGTLAVTTATIANLNNAFIVDGIRYPQTDAGIQAAINDANNGAGAAVVYLPAGNYVMKNNLPIILAGSISLIGAGLQTSLNVDTSVSTDIISVRANAFSTIRDFYIHTSGGAHPGRYGIRLDGNYGNVEYVDINHVIMDRLGSYAIEGDGNSQGTPILSTIENSALPGGILLTNCGDTVNILRNQIGGPGYGLNITMQNGAADLMIANNNIPADLGLHFGAGYDIQLVSNEIEAAATFTGSNGAMIDVDGPMSQMAISGNSLQMTSLTPTTNGIRVNNAYGTQIVGNIIQPLNSPGLPIVTTSKSTSTYIGTNQYYVQFSTPPFQNVLSDAGLGTVVASAQDRGAFVVASTVVFYDGGNTLTPRMKSYVAGLVGESGGIEYRTFNGGADAVVAKISPNVAGLSAGSQNVGLDFWTIASGSLLKPMSIDPTTQDVQFGTTGQVSTFTAAGSLVMASGATMTGNGSGLTSLPAANLTGAVPTGSINLSTVTTVFATKASSGTNADITFLNGTGGAVGVIGSTLTVSLNGQIGAPKQYGCRAVDATTQVWAASVVQLAYFGTNNYCYPSSFHSTTVSSGTFTVPADGAGHYYVMGECTWASFTGTLTNLYVFQNGAIVAEALNPHLTSTGGVAELQVSDVLAASGGDTFQLKCFQNSAGTVNTTGDNMVFTIQKLW